MSILRFTVMLLLLSTTSVFAEDLTKKVERLELEKSTLELKVDALSSKVSQLEQLQEAHEVLLKKLISQLWEIKVSGSPQGNASSGTRASSPGQTYR